MKEEYILVIMRETNQILYGGYDHPRAHRIATTFADAGKCVKKIYREIPDWLRHSAEGKDPADWWEFRKRGNTCTTIAGGSPGQ